MLRRLFAKAVVSVGLSGVVLLAGCTSSGTSSSASASDYRVSATSAEPAPQRPSQRSTHDTTGNLIAYPTGDPKTSVISLERVVSPEVQLNQPFSYELRVTNLTNQTLQDVVVSDALSSNLVIKSAEPKGQIGSSGFAKWSLGSLDPKQTRTIRVTAVATVDKVATSCASLTYNSLLCSHISIVEPNLQVTMVGPAEVLLCDDILYRFSVANIGTGSIQNVQINGELPGGLVTDSGKRSIAFNVGHLTPGQSRQYTATVKATKRGQFASKVTASGGKDVSAVSNAVTTTVREPVLAITKTGPKSKFLGRPTTYQITVTNTGDGVARDVVVQDTLSSGTKFVSASDGGRWTNEKVNWVLGSLPPKASKKITVTVSSALASVVRSVAQARAYCASPVEAIALTQYKGIPAILLEVVDLQDPIEVGQVVTYVITATNQGTAPGTNIGIVCNLESNLQHISSTGTTRGGVIGRNLTFDPVKILAPGAKATWRIMVKAVKTGDVRFKVSMNSDQLGRPVEESEATTLYAE